MKTKLQKYQHKKAPHSAGFILALYSTDTRTILAPYLIHTEVILGSYSFHIIEPLQIRVAYTLPHKSLEIPKSKIAITTHAQPIVQFFFDKIITKTFSLRAPPSSKSPERAKYNSMRYKPILYKNIKTKTVHQFSKGKNKMSEINNGILGKMTGSIGNITGKVRNGKNILALKPASFNAASDPDSIARREKFAMTVKFAKAVNDLTTLKTLWQKVTSSDLSSFNYIVKTNYPSFLNGVFSSATTITPLLGFPASTSSAELTQNGISFAVNPLANAYDFDLSLETKLKPVILLSFANPGNLALEPSQFISVEVPANNFVANDPVTFSTTFNDYIKSLFDNYSSRSAWVALVTLDNNSLPVNFSQTIII